jgi:hypothetical protein
LNIKLLNIPEKRPIPTEAAARARKLPRISKGELAVKLKLVLKLYTVLNKIILTMSLNTPSPYTIENNFGDSL